MDDTERAALRAKYERPTFALPQASRLRSPQAGLLGVCLLVLTGLLFSLKMPLQRSDDFYRVIGAWSLAAGQGYADISRPDVPFMTKYPPLPSLLMAPFIGLLGDFLRPLRLLSIFPYVASLPLAYRLLRSRTSHRRALLLLLLVGLHPLTLRGMNFEGNAGIMTLLILGAVTLLENVRRPAREGQWALSLGLLLAAYFYCHRIGIVFGIGSILYIFFVARQRRLALLTALVFGGLALPWLWRCHAVSGHWISPEYETELVGRSVAGATVHIPGPIALLQHMLSEARQFPTEVGYGLFPWSHASGGEPWPFLKAQGLVWVATLGEWTIATLVLIGWAVSLRARRFMEIYLILHTVMLLVFFFGFQYFWAFLPWFYLYLTEGAERVLGTRWRRTAWPGYLAILLVLLAKDTKAFWLLPPSYHDRDLRWSWIAKLVPAPDTVYYLGLKNYAFSQLRYFDSGQRKAVGVTEQELEALFRNPLSPARWVCLPRTSPQNAQLQKAGWQPVVAEPEGIVPTAKQLEGVELSAAQQAFVNMMEPAQALWRRPVQ